MANRLAIVTILSTTLSLAASVGCSRNPETAKQQFYSRGNSYFEKQRYREAVIEYSNAVQIDPNFAAARRRLAESYEKTGDLANALAEFVRAADSAPADADLQLKAGTYLLAARRFDEARARAESALALKPKNADAQVLLGNSLAGLRSIEQAISEIEEAIRIEPTRAATYTNLGILEMTRGRAEEAEEAFKRTITLEPSWVPGHLALANHYWATGRSPAAEKELLQAIALEPSNVIANRALAVFYVSTNRVAQAEPYVRALAKSGGAPFALADFYVYLNRIDSAIPELQQLRTDSRVGTDATHRLAQAYAIRGDYPSAHRVIDEMLQKDAKNTGALLLKGQLLSQEGKREEAMKQLTAAAAVDPSSAPLQFALGRLHAARGDIDDARKAYNEVLRLNPRASAAQVELSRLDLLGGNVDSSINYAREAVRNEPRSLDAQVTLIRGLIARKQLDEAQRVLDPLLAKNPKISALQIQKAFLLAARKDIGGARQAFNDALALSPGSAEAISGLVVLEASNGRAKQARTVIQEQLEKRPNEPSLLLIAARAAAAAKDLTSAEQHLRRAVELDPSLFAGYAMLGQLYVMRGELDSARKEFEILASRESRPVAALTMLGIIAQAKGDTPGAQERFQGALDLEPSAPVAANNLAWIYAERGEKLDTALQLARAASERLPQSAEVQDTLAWVYYKRKTYDRALTSIDEAIRLSPKNPTYYYHQGLIRMDAGQTEAARQSLERAVALRTPFASENEVRRLLSTLQDRPAAGK